jgi:hypothetical protein
MTEIKAYSGSPNSGHMSLISGKCLLILLFFFVMPMAIPLLAQEDPLYDEISVYIKIPHVGVGEIDVLIRGEEVWIPVTDLFDFLKIRNVPSQDLDLITGFFIAPEATYTIDRPGNKIIYGDKTYILDEGDLVRSETRLYLRALWYGKIFGLDCKFGFRDLTITIDTKLELPGIREMKLEEMRANLTRLKGDVTVDTTVGRTYPGFRFGMADWSVYATEVINGTTEPFSGLCNCRRRSLGVP